MQFVLNVSAKIILFAGLALGAIVGWEWFHFWWLKAAAEPSGHYAMRAFSLGFSGGFFLLAMIAWPFAALAEWLDRPPRRDATKPSEPLTSAPRSRPARSTALTPAKRR
jgi:hypothetical protein